MPANSMSVEKRRKQVMSNESPRPKGSWSKRSKGCGSKRSNRLRSKRPDGSCSKRSNGSWSKRSNRSDRRSVWQIILQWFGARGQRAPESVAFFRFDDVVALFAAVKGRRDDRPPPGLVPFAARMRTFGPNGPVLGQDAILRAGMFVARQFLDQIDADRRVAGEQESVPELGPTAAGHAAVVVVSVCKSIFEGSTQEGGGAMPNPTVKPPTEPQALLCRTTPPPNSYFDCV